jgi:hypothetical protein
MWLELKLLVEFNLIKQVCHVVQFRPNQINKRYLNKKKKKKKAM